MVRFFSTGCFLFMDRYTTARGTQHAPRLGEHVLQSTRTGVSQLTPVSARIPRPAGQPIASRTRPGAGFHPRHPRNPKPKIGGRAKPETQGPWRGETRNPRSVPRRNPKPSTKFLFADPFTPLTSLFPCRSTYSSDLTLFPFFHPSSSLPPLKQKRKGRPGRPMAPLSLEHALCPATYTPYLPFWTLTAENTSQNL